MTLTAPETIASAQDLTDTYADLGDVIDVRDIDVLGVYIDCVANDSLLIDINSIGHDDIPGTKDYILDGVSEKEITGSGETDDVNRYFTFDVEGLIGLTIQGKAGTVGSTAGTLALRVTKKIKNPQV